MYPANWPRCPKCDDFALDGHITCGRLECNESAARSERERIRTRGEYRRSAALCTNKGGETE